MPWVTTTTLLEGLGDPDNSAAWNRFVGRFRPIIVACACRFGVRQDEAEDIAQETLSAFLNAYLAGKYDPEKGRLRSWVFGIAKNQALKAIRARGGDRQMTSSFWPDQPDAETTWTKKVDNAKHRVASRLREPGEMFEEVDGEFS